MSIGVLKNVDLARYPGLKRLMGTDWTPPARDPTPLSSLRETSTDSPGIQSRGKTPKCQHCHGIKNISGEVCQFCGDREQDIYGGQPITDLNLSEPMDLAFRLLKVQPGLEEAAQSIVTGGTAPEIPPMEEEEPEIEEESDMDRLDRELQTALESIHRSKKIHAEMGRTWVKPGKRGDMRGNVQSRALPRDPINLGE